MPKKKKLSEKTYNISVEYSGWKTYMVKAKTRKEAEDKAFEQYMLGHEGIDGNEFASEIQTDFKNDEEE